MNRHEEKSTVIVCPPSVRRSEKPTHVCAAGAYPALPVDLYATYPNLKIDIDKEQQQLLAHDVIIFSSHFVVFHPGDFKEWQDLVLERGFAYGKAAQPWLAKPFVP